MIGFKLENLLYIEYCTPKYMIVNIEITQRLIIA